MLIFYKHSLWNARFAFSSSRLSFSFVSFFNFSFQCTVCFLPQGELLNLCLSAWVESTADNLNPSDWAGQLLQAWFPVERFRYSRVRLCWEVSWAKRVNSLRRQCRENLPSRLCWKPGPSLSFFSFAGCEVHWNEISVVQLILRSQSFLRFCTQPRFDRKGN